MAELSDLLASTDTRPRALELMLVAHVALHRECLDGRRRPRLSATARRLVELLEDVSPAIPLSPEMVCLYLDRLPDAELEPIAHLANDAAQLTIADLSFLSRNTVLALLGATEAFARPTSDATPLATHTLRVSTPVPPVDIAPWKQRMRAAHSV